MSYLWKALGIPEPMGEYRFHPIRRWRFDWAWPEERVALEIEGGIWMAGKGAHSRPMNIIRDQEKQNEAGKLGWRIFRFSPREFKKGIAQAFMQEVFIYSKRDK